MFERAHHRRIARVLDALDPAVLAANACYFGGGTAMALRFGEYRESVDIDFLVSSLAGYRALRQLVTGPDGLRPIGKPGASFDQLRELRADQYGLRTLLRVDEAVIKFEIVLEGRIELEAPSLDDRICGIACLTALDMATSKLLANSDRWRDDAVLSRDLIDLAMMAPAKGLMSAALAKASAAYGVGIEADLNRAIDLMRERPQRLDACMAAMQMTGLSKAQLWARIKALGVKPRAAAPGTK